MISRLTACDESFDWCVRRAESCLGRVEFEDAAKWCQIAGKLSETFGISYFSVERLEKILIKIAQNLCSKIEPNANSVNEKIRWLHVLTQAYKTGGHTALCRRWIEYDSSNDNHSIVLTAQNESESDPKLLNIIKSKGGEITFLDTTATILSRAYVLRKLSTDYDVIVLHVHMWDPIAPIAFGVTGGAPVLVVNHADHLYWMGVSVADLIVNIRPSGESLCAQYRGSDRLARLALPLPLPSTAREQEKYEKQNNRSTNRAKINIPDTAILFLTIGSAYKFEPTSDLSFFEAAKKIVTTVPGSYIIAIGPSPGDRRWERVSIETEGRVCAVGRKQDLSIYFASADIYLEGFPFGSLTALLEAVLAGLPPILAPANCPLPFRSDDFALTIDAPNNADHYVAMAVELAKNEKLRTSSSQALKRALVEWHCGAGWNKRLGEVRGAVTNGERHRIWPVTDVIALPDDTLRYWASFSAQRTNGDDPFRFVLRNSVLSGLKPKPDVQLFKAMINAAQTKSDLFKAASISCFSHCLSILPSALAKRLFNKM